MTRYGKLTDGKLRFAPNPLVVGGQHIFTNDPIIYAEHGWLPVVYMPAPECPEGYNLSAGWQEQGGKITRIWSAKQTESGEDE